MCHSKARLLSAARQPRLQASVELPLLAGETEKNTVPTSPEAVCWDKSAFISNSMTY